MNHTCFGTYWPAAKMYRCLGDGKVFAAEELPAVCPNCKREIVAKTMFTAALRKVTTQQIQGPDGNWFNITSSASKPVISEPNYYYGKISHARNNQKNS